MEWDGITVAQARRIYREGLVDGFRQGFMAATEPMVKEPEIQIG